MFGVVCLEGLAVAVLELPFVLLVFGLPLLFVVVVAVVVCIGVGGFLSGAGNSMTVGLVGVRVDWWKALSMRSRRRSCYGAS